MFYCQNSQRYSTLSKNTSCIVQRSVILEGTYNQGRSSMWFVLFADPPQDLREAVVNLVVKKSELIRHSHISQNAPFFFPRNFIEALFSISLGRAVIPRRNEKQRLCKIWGSKQGVLCEMCKWWMCSLEKITGASRFFWHYIKEKITSRITVLVALQCKNNAKKLGRFINRFPF